MSRRGWVLFALMSVLWGIPYLMIKVAVEGVSVPMLVFARTALGAILLLPLAVRAGGFGVVRRHWRPLLAFAVLEILGPWALLSDAERRLTSSMTGLLIAAVPIIAVVLARLTGDAERLGPVRWVGLLVGLGGVGVLAGPHLGGGDAWALGEVMLVALGYATAPLIATRRLQDVPSLHLAASSLALAAVVYTGPAIATWPDELPSGPVLAALAGLGVVCTAVAFMVFFELIREVGTSRAMVFTYVNPAVAVAAGVLFLDEPLSATIVASFALILCGSVLATARRGPATVPEPGPAPELDTVSDARPESGAGTVSGAGPGSDAVPESGGRA
ncbi:DMT family transporter [Actinomadura rubrisoli]|uniref:DMT family transporter n=1 Tax=Actinomadura rubrisoli TaxID=2530368 RepID=A0A4R5BYF3_9ACTN|nr:DMT family transporter [Actinomadura rubrisoli]TDD90753.1 DMT family transporter [Actinomadura rubrisoli]